MHRPSSPSLLVPVLALAVATVGPVTVRAQKSQRLLSMNIWPMNLW